jgi:hypothetical protein
MERYCSTGQSPQRAVALTEEEEEEVLYYSGILLKDNKSPSFAKFHIFYGVVILIALKAHNNTEAIGGIMRTLAY